MTTRLVLKDELPDAQLLRAVGAAPAGEDAFRRGAALLDVPPESSRSARGDIPAWVLLPRHSRLRTPADAGADRWLRRTVEELYFMTGAAALARGYNVLAFDGPGQGAALIEHGLALRPNWENVVTPVVDYALTRPDVDGERVALIGLSLGGYLAPRAASVEHRLAACVAHCPRRAGRCVGCSS